MKKLAQVTVELRNLLKTNFKLFDFDYPFDDKNFASQLEEAVIEFYHNYEIGQETPDEFKRVFKRRWLQAVGYYNELHNTTLLQYNPLINYSMNELLEQLSTTNRTEENTGTTDSTTNASGTSNSTRTDDLTANTDSNTISSDYPQQAIAGGDYLSGQQQSETETTNTGTVQDNTTNSTDATDNTTVEGTTTTEGQDNTNYEKTIEGLTGTTYQELIKKERDNMLRITGMVIEELKPCFILVH